MQALHILPRVRGLLEGVGAVVVVVFPVSMDTDALLLGGGAEGSWDLHRDRRIQLSVDLILITCLEKLAFHLLNQIGSD